VKRILVSSRLSASLSNHSGSQGKNFGEILYCGFVLKFVDKNKFLLKPNKTGDARITEDFGAFA